MAQKKCRMCLGEDFKLVINFGKNPLVNSLIEKEDLDKQEKVYPLKVEQCQKCFLVQIVDPIDSHKIYRDQDYLYYSSDMPGLKDYFLSYAEELKSLLGETDNKSLLEIGSNDGIFLEHFKNWGFKILGVDPSTNVVIRALSKGLTTASDMFSKRLAKSILKEFGKFKLIGGSNCIAHLNDLKDLLEGVKILLDDKGIFFVECNYWGGMVRNKNYSLIYHDHFSYFSLKNWCDFLKNYDMKVFDAWVTPAQGGSLRLFATNDLERKETERFINLYEGEIKSELNSYKTCLKYKKEVLSEARKLGNLVKGLKDSGKTIAGYGAAAKGFSILKLANIGEKEIDYFVDDSPAKQGRFTPVSHIPVLSRKDAENILPDYFFITAPNYERVIVDKEKDFRDKGGKFITSDCRIL